MQKQMDTGRPWYKERWFWLLMSGPLLVVIAGFVTFGIIVRGADDMVNDDYYRQGKDINLELKRDLAARSLGIGAQVMFSDDMRSVRVVDTSSKPLPGTPELLLLHPTRQQGDQRIVLQRIGDKLYQGVMKPDQTNHWYVRLQDTQGRWRVQSEWLPAEGTMITLGKTATEQNP
ncbi:FixH family protein [Vogesella fluminis]|nr:FixH family protein [Vogesella fluminis]